MTSATAVSATQREPELPGQTVVVIGGSSGIGRQTARRARAEGADVILTGRNPERLQHAARELHARRTAAFDATEPAALQRFFDELPESIDHVMVTAGGQYYARPRDSRRRDARPGRQPGGQVAPARVNLIAAGFVDTPLSASLLGGDLDKRRDQLRAMLPIGRVVGPADVAALAVHIMTNTRLPARPMTSTAASNSSREHDRNERPAEAGHRGTRRHAALGADLPVPGGRASITGAIWALKGHPGGPLDRVVLEGETRDQQLTITPFSTSLARPTGTTSWRCSCSPVRTS